jgi:hypothetical protein
MTETVTFDVPTLLMSALPRRSGDVDCVPWQSVAVSSLTEAEQLLDQYETRGSHGRALVVCKRDLFLVRWR